MADLVLFGGFLGSGKTTCILDFARYLVQRRQQVAIIVNEAGEIPIDGAVFIGAGNRVREIFGGCICCQLRGDVIDGIRELLADRNLDYLILEPSGMAEPASLLGLISGQLGLRCVQVAVVDAARFDLLMRAVEPLIRSSLRGASIALVNKIDNLAPDGLALVLDRLAQLFPEVRAVAVSARQGVPTRVWAELAGGEKE